MHYSTGDFVDSAPNVVTLRTTELMSQGVKIVCSQYSLVDPGQDELDMQMDDVDNDQPSLRSSISKDRVIHLVGHLQIGLVHIPGNLEIWLARTKI